MAGSLSERPRAGRQAILAWLEHLAHERRASPRTLEAYGFAGFTFTVGTLIDAVSFFTSTFGTVTFAVSVPTSTVGV